MTKITIKKLLVKEGVGKNGKPWKRYSILTQDKTGQDVWIGCFPKNGDNNVINGWSEGQEVELTIHQEEYNGKMSYVFEEPAQRDIFKEIDEIKSMLNTLLAVKQFGGQIENRPLNNADFLKEQMANDNRMTEKEIRVEDITF